MAEKCSDVYSFGGVSMFRLVNSVLTKKVLAISVKTYPIPFHITAWSIFFGPIIILVPLLLLLELLILGLLYLSFLSHGVYLGLSSFTLHIEIYSNFIALYIRPNGESISGPQGIFYGHTGIAIFDR